MFRLRLSAALAAAALALSAGSAAAQDTAGPVTAKNTFFVELGGNALVYSLNYERFFTPKLALRVGGMYLQADDDFGDEAAVGFFPVMATYLLGQGNGHFEVGGGLGFATAGASSTDIGEDFSDSTVYGTATFGYRYQKPEGGVIFRAGFTPLIVSGSIIPWAGISVGYAF